MRARACYFILLFFLLFNFTRIEIKVKWILNFKVTNKTSHEIYSPLCVWYIEVRCNILKFVSVVDLIIRDGMRWRKLSNILFDRLIRSPNSWYINAIIYICDERLRGRWCTITDIKEREREEGHDKRRERKKKKKHIFF